MKKVSAAKFTNSLNNVANNLNNNVRRVVKNEMAINLIRVLIILYTSFVVPVLDANTLAVLNNNVVRLVVCALIVYLSFMDVITAVLLTIAFVLTLHQGNKRVTGNNVIQDIEVNREDNELVNRINNISDVKVENYEDLNNALNQSPIESSNLNQVEQVLNNETNVNNVPLNDVPLNINSVNNVPLNNVPENNNQEAVNTNVAENINDIPIGMDTSPEANMAVFNNSSPQNVQAPMRELPMEEINSRHPASSTMTDNLLAVGAEFDKNAPVGLTTSQNLYDASENAVPGADIMNQVVSVEGSLSAQGMNEVLGANYARHDGYHYTDGNGLVHNGIRNNAVRKN
jgi:hypothetical protein